MLARSLQRIALERLAALCPKDLSPALALRMLRLGLEEERMALGLTKAAGETIASHWQG